MGTTQRKSTKTKGKRKSAKIIQLNVFNQAPETSTANLINGVWNVARAALWPNQNFSEKEKFTLKRLIADHFKGELSHKRTFKELLERICLAKRYVSRKRGRYISKPQDWLNIYYPLGLSGTDAWLERVYEIRSDVPEYNQGIHTFAKAILAYMEKPTENTFHKYRVELMEQKQFDLLQVFYATIINQQVSI